MAFAVNQFDQQFALRVGEFLHPRLVGLEYLVLHLLHVLFLALLCGDGFQNLRCLVEQLLGFLGYR